MIELKGVSKIYGKLVAVHRADFVIASGQTTVLIGPSGCGKSTLLRIVAGLVAPSAGTVEFDGKPLDQRHLIEARRKIGYVIQDGGLFPHLTAEQNVVLMAKHLSKPDTFISERLEKLCKLTHFPMDGLKRYPAELSGGQRQRVGLMRALMLEPQALLLDEPLGAQAVLLVTHDMGEAAYLGDMLILMREGHILQQGSLKDFQENPADPFVTEFLTAQRSLVAL
jgi:osmoprotectant transport system ATP-binding protein